MKKKISEDQMREYRLRRAKRRKNQVKLGMVMLCTLVVLVIAMYCGTALYLQVTKKDDDAVEAMGEAVTYSQEELDRYVSQAVAEAETRAGEEIQAAEEAAYEAILNEIRTDLSQGQTVLEVLRPLYPEDLIVASNGQYHFVPIDRGLRQSQLIQENVNVLESGEIQYMEGDQVISHKGIDVSKHQGKIDWAKVAQDGVEFAFIRVALRGYGTGKLVEDEFFDQNMQGAQAGHHGRGSAGGGRYGP